MQNLKIKMTNQNSKLTKFKIDFIISSF